MIFKADLVIETECDEDEIIDGIVEFLEERNSTMNGVWRKFDNSIDLMEYLDAHD